MFTTGFIEILSFIGRSAYFVEASEYFDREFRELKYGRIGASSFMFFCIVCFTNTRSWRAQFLWSPPGTGTSSRQFQEISFWKFSEVSKLNVLSLTIPSRRETLLVKHLGPKSVLLAAPNKVIFACRAVRSAHAGTHSRAHCDL